MAKVNKKGFTLAEILITIGIIGVISALTIPSLYAKINELIIVTKLKKFYSTISQAVLLNEQENPGAYYTTEHMLDTLTIKTICTNNDTSCAPLPYKFYNGSNTNYWGINDNQRSANNYAILADGGILRYSGSNFSNKVVSHCSGVMGTSDALQAVCSEISIDVNGSKLPNTFGKDVFFFYVTAYGLVPFGAKEITHDDTNYTTCKRTGYGCAAYVLKYGTLDYNKNPF